MATEPNRDLVQNQAVHRKVEALLFASDQPLSLSKLAGLFPSQDRKKLKEAVGALQKEYDERGNAFTIVEFGGGYSITTRKDYASLVRKLFRGRRKARLSKAALECLSIIAYKQPVTRLEMEEIRGVSVSGVLGTLLERDLIHIVGRAESLGHPLLYGTTRTFLDYLGLKRLQDLPQLSELEDLLAEKEELKQLAARYAGELSDEDIDEVLGDGNDDEDSPGDRADEVISDGESLADADDEAAEAVSDDVTLDVPGVSDSGDDVLAESAGASPTVSGGGADK